MRIFYLVVVCSFVLGITVGVSAQENDQKIKIEQHLGTSKEYLQKNIDSALFYAEKALSMSKSVANDTLIAKSNLQKSSVLLLKKGLKKQIHYSKITLLDHYPNI